ncbi:MAG: hypothetical protein QW666_03675 [Candidatus Woesearchaeota archaeon]
MKTETNTLEDIAIEDFVAEIETENAAKVFIQTMISKFQDTYTIENPSNVKKKLMPVVRALQGLQRKGFDMKPYADQLVAMAVEEYNKYSGQKDTFAHASTLTVVDAVTHKRDTGYWKKEK